MSKDYNTVVHGHVAFPAACEVLRPAGGPGGTRRGRLRVCGMPGGLPGPFTKLMKADGVMVVR